MEKLILEKNREDYYVLEVNDKGDTIEFDLTDIGLAERIMNSSDRITEQDKKYQKRVVELSETFKDDEVQLTREIIKLEKEQCQEMRRIFDDFLGEGACQKIFGDKNNYGQFNRLLDALEPHYKKMELKMQKAKRKLADKYMEKEKDVM
jgi:hypothetical protein